jgi:hypothetical protein
LKKLPPGGFFRPFGLNRMPGAFVPVKSITRRDAWIEKICIYDIDGSNSRQRCCLNKQLQAHSILKGSTGDYMRVLYSFYRIGQP